MNDLDRRITAALQAAYAAGQAEERARVAALRTYAVHRPSCAIEIALREPTEEQILDPTDESLPACSCGLAGV